MGKSSLELTKLEIEYRNKELKRDGTKSDIEAGSGVSKEEVTKERKRRKKGGKLQEARLKECKRRIRKSNKTY